MSGSSLELRLFLKEWPRTKNVEPMKLDTAVTGTVQPDSRYAAFRPVVALPMMAVGM
jgi:hypothetical protein